MTLILIISQRYCLISSFSYFFPFCNNKQIKTYPLDLTFIDSSGLSQFLLESCKMSRVQLLSCFPFLAFCWKQMPLPSFIFLSCGCAHNSPPSFFLMVYALCCSSSSLSGQTQPKIRPMETPSSWFLYPVTIPSFFIHIYFEH